MAKKADVPANPEAGVPQVMQSKTAIVLSLLQGGLSSPKEISEAAKKLGVDVTPNYVSMIKGKKGAKKKGRGKKRIVSSSGEAVTAQPKPASQGSTLSLENLALRFALKAGS